MKPEWKFRLCEDLGLIFSILLIISICILLSTPWWYMHEKWYWSVGNKVEEHDQYTLTNGKHTSEGFSEFTETQSASYREENNYLDDCDNFKQVMRNTLALSVLAFIFSVLFIISVFVVRFEKPFISICLILGILTLVLMLTIPIYFKSALPNAISEDLNENNNSYSWGEILEDESTSPSRDFSGYEKIGCNSYSWGADSGWYFSILGFIFAFLGTICCIYLTISKNYIFQNQFIEPYYRIACN